MRRLALLAVAVAFFATLNTEAGDAKKDLEALQGDWKVESMQESDGKNPPDSAVNDLKATFKAEDFKVTTKGETFIYCKIKVDPAKMPKAIDFTHQEGPDKGKTELGIYQVEGAKLTICINDPGKPRPTSFATQAGTKISLIVLSRGKKA